MNPTLSHRLDAHLRALDHGLPENAADVAQQKLERRLQRRAPKAPARRWAGWAAAVATASLMMALVLLPTSHGIAFDAVQQRLRDFHTLTLQIEQQAQGMAMPPIRVRMNRRGDVRTDFGTATSMVVNTQEHRVLTLLHDSRHALQMPLPATADAPAPLAWLEPVRRFQGEARRLPGTRIIDGTPTTGWTLDVQGMRITIWADADALPRAVEMDADGATLRQAMHVTLDAPIDPQVFSTAVPPGYAVMPAAGDDTGEPH
ncbi:hypothetical protein [Dyella sp.]|jgi:hypothetical protein|uniref:hypothetical protein n=1 Tax=Dyella sp. TaxID=1869338 RepID=UPI002D7868AB|nr:hypothetical protein [Dyella sp.]HET6431628.1 hypothetical protein [Dyella sp.]